MGEQFSFFLMESEQIAYIDKAECVAVTPSAFTFPQEYIDHSGYNQVQKVTHCGSGAHMNRKWREAMPVGATVKTSKAAVGYQYSNKLFALEKKCADFNNKLRKEYRQNFIQPVLEEYFCWVNTLAPEEGSKLETAMKYAQNQQGPLSAFIDHGDVPISNNLAENAIRPFAVGRKNRLFCDTVKGAESSAIVYSLVETAMPWSSEVQQQIGKQAQGNMNKTILLTAGPIMDPAVNGCW